MRWCRLWWTKPFLEQKNFSGMEVGASKTRSFASTCTRERWGGWGWWWWFLSRTVKKSTWRSTPHGEPSGMVFTTPPSWSMDIPQGGMRAKGKGGVRPGSQTEGLMSFEDEGEEHVAWSTSHVDDLQRSLEEEVVRKLHEENVRLKAEVQRLQVEQQPSTASWSEVSEVPPPPPQRGWDEVRYTPGGTRIPSGPPSAEECEDLWQKLPKWPLDGYEMVADLCPCGATLGMCGMPVSVEMGHGRDLHDGRDGRGIQSRQDQALHPPAPGGGIHSRQGHQEGKEDVMTAAQAKAVWLERELASLQQVLNRECRSQAFGGEYWSVPTKRWDDKTLQPDEDHGDGRARGDRAGIGSFEVGDGRARGDRAGIGSFEVGDGRARGDRAGIVDFEAGDGRARGDRAGMGSFEVGDCRARGDRAGMGSFEVGDCRARGDRAGIGNFEVGDGRARGDRACTGGFSGGDGRVQGERGNDLGVGADEDKDNLKAVSVTLPQLPPHSGQESGIACGDWLVQVRPLVGDMSAGALQWWDNVLGAVTRQYKWLLADPLERLRLLPPLESEYNTTALRRRLDLRTSTLLLGSLTELVASRHMTTGAILYRIMRNYQPGGLQEKTETLQALTVIQPGKSPRDATEKLQKWRRHQLRAQELCATLPDASILCRALGVIVGEVLSSAPQASFRLNSFRLQSRLDVMPTAENLEQYYQMLLAEMETLSLNPEGPGQLQSRLWLRLQRWIPLCRALLQLRHRVATGVRMQDAGKGSHANLLMDIYRILENGVGIAHQRSIEKLNALRALVGMPAWIQLHRCRLHLGGVVKELGLVARAKESQRPKEAKEMVKEKVVAPMEKVVQENLSGKETRRQVLASTKHKPQKIKEREQHHLQRLQRRLQVLKNSLRRRMTKKMQRGHNRLRPSKGKGTLRQALERWIRRAWCRRSQRCWGLWECKDRDWAQYQSNGWNGTCRKLHYWMVERHTAWGQLRVNRSGMRLKNALLLLLQVRWSWSRCVILERWLHKTGQLKESYQFVSWWEWDWRLCGRMRWLRWRGKMGHVSQYMAGWWMPSGRWQTGTAVDGADRGKQLSLSWDEKDLEIWKQRSRRKAMRQGVGEWCDGAISTISGSTTLADWTYPRSVVGWHEQGSLQQETKKKTDGSHYEGAALVQWRAYEDVDGDGRGRFGRGLRWDWAGHRLLGR